MMRSIENTMYFSSVSYASKNSGSATSIIDPQGNCIAYQVYVTSGVLIRDVDPHLATGLLAKRFKIIYMKNQKIKIDDKVNTYLLGRLHFLPESQLAKPKRKLGILKGKAKVTFKDDFKMSDEDLTDDIAYQVQEW